jgi:hypothetical protein
MESRETELCNKLYKTEEEQQIFLGFRFRNKNGRKKQAKQNIFGFFKYQTKNRKQSKPKLESYRGK